MKLTKSSPSFWAPRTDEFTPKGGGHRRPIPQAELRQMGKASHEGGRFRCPKCHEYFGVAVYSTYGNMGWGTETGMYCKDCAQTPGFRKL